MKVNTLCVYIVYRSKQVHYTAIPNRFKCCGHYLKCHCFRVFFCCHYLRVDNVFIFMIHQRKSAHTDEEMVKNRFSSFFPSVIATLTVKGNVGGVLYNAK